MDDIDPIDIHDAILRQPDNEIEEENAVQEEEVVRLNTFLTCSIYIYKTIGGSTANCTYKCNSWRSTYIRDWVLFNSPWVSKNK